MLPGGNNHEMFFEENLLMKTSLENKEKELVGRRGEGEGDGSEKVKKKQF